MRKIFNFILIGLMIFGFSSCSINDNDELSVKQGELLIKETFKDFKAPKSFMYRTATSFVGNSIPTESVSFVDGENRRTDIQLPGLYDSAKIISIYNADKGFKYRYTENDSEGDKIKISNDGNSTNELEYLLESIENGSFKDYIKMVKLDEVNGEEAILIETYEKNFIGLKKDITMKKWISTKYGIPLKFEIDKESMPDGNAYKFEVTEIKEGDYSDKMIPPKNMKWIEKK